MSQIPWRAMLANWPDEWRERWGHRANALEDTGLPWVEAEKQAWDETQAMKREASERVPEPAKARATNRTLFRESA